MHALNFIWFGNITRRSSGEERGNFLVKMIFTYRRYVYRKVGGGRHPVSRNSFCCSAQLFTADPGTALPVAHSCSQQIQLQLLDYSQQIQVQLLQQLPAVHIKSRNSFAGSWQLFTADTGTASSAIHSFSQRYNFSSNSHTQQLIAGSHFLCLLVYFVSCCPNT